MRLTNPYQPPTPDEVTLECQRVLPNEPAIAKAVDDWLLMERKARAWDELVRLVEMAHPDPVSVGNIDLELWLAHPAREPSTS